ncbi:MAG: DUF3054 domain-containing protein [Nocardioides sp.]
MKRAAAFVVDILLILGFAAIGRRNHDESGALTDVLRTAAPFLIGLVAGWVVATMRRMDVFSYQFGLFAWGTTLFFGMALRSFFGSGTAISFVLVAAIGLSVTLVGWRLAYRAIRAG